MNQDLLQTISEVGVALAGFSGVVFVLSPRARGGLTVAEKNGLAHLLFTSCGVTILALVQAALLAGMSDLALVWRIGNALTAVFVLIGAAKAVTEELRGEHSLPYPIGWIVPVGAFALAATNGLAAVGFMRAYSPHLCVAILIYILFVSLVYFASLVFPAADAV